MTTGKREYKRVFRHFMCTDAVWLVA